MRILPEPRGSQTVEGAAPPLPALDLDPPAVLLDDARGACQPDGGAGDPPGDIAAPVEALEDVRSICGPDADPAVDHPQRGLLCRACLDHLVPHFDVAQTASTRAAADVRLSLPDILDGRVDFTLAQVAGFDLPGPSAPDPSGSSALHEAGPGARQSAQ